MKFEHIDINTWKRKEYFNHYINTVPCTYSMTVNIDTTNFLKKLKEKGIKLYPAMIYALSLIVNKYDEFRTSFDEEQRLGIFKKMNPSYTIFHSRSETFSSIWTQFDENFLTFYKGYQDDIKTYGEVSGLIAKTNMPINNFNISILSDN